MNLGAQWDRSHHIGKEGIVVGWGSTRVSWLDLAWVDLLAIGSCFLPCLLGREASWQAEVLVDGIFLSCAISAELRVEIEMLWLSAVSVTTETRLTLARGWMAGYFF